jgi:hypothetical protein
MSLNMLIEFGTRSTSPVAMSHVGVGAADDR